MLSRLTISNYALIDNAEIEFGAGFTTVTGETGAGKSIMLDALGLILGERADAKMIRQEKKNVVVEAEFTEVPDELTTEFDIEDNEGAGIFVVRRQISPSGRSRAFVNDVPVSQKQLHDIGSRLIDIHSQHASLAISDPSAQLRMIDAVADNAELLAEYSAAFHDYVTLRNRIQALKQERDNFLRDQEFIRFQLDQLDRLDLRPGELQELERRFRILSDSGELQSSLAETASLLGESDESALNLIAKARAILSKINFDLFKSGSDGSPSIPERLESAYVEFRDIAETVADIASEVESDPAELQFTEERISLINDAMRRFNTDSPDRLIEISRELRSRIASIENAGNDITDLEPELKLLGRKMKLAADRLSESRAAAAQKFSDRLVETARTLGLANLKFSALLSRGKFSHTGQDKCEFLCSFNKNSAMRPIAEIASGGEISRLMLSIKAIAGESLAIPTIIFDEIDTGVSGEIADKMGALMSRMGEFRQVVAITHLPQVAAKGSEQLRVFKSDSEERTTTHIEKLTDSRRVEEIAKMLAGATVGEAALSNARALLKIID